MSPARIEAESCGRAGCAWGGGWGGGGGGEGGGRWRHEKHLLVMSKRLWQCSLVRMGSAFFVLF